MHAEGEQTTSVKISSMKETTYYTGQSDNDKIFHS